MKKKHIFPLILWLALLALPACNSVPLLSAQETLLGLIKPVEQTPATATAPISDESIAALQSALEGIYTKVSPSVVSIQVLQKDQTSFPTLPETPGFRFFFGPNGPELPQQPGPQEQYRRGAGSGFIWDKDGHIITNNHVVDSADKIRVIFADGASAEAQVVGTDPQSDLAVLKVDMPADRLQPVELADSTQIKVGQLAVAIGNPFTLENTMTVGFVSAVGRQLPVSSGVEQGVLSGPSYTIPDIIQTDAPINPGNSGGVLTNDQGQVIGVTAAIESPVRANAGIGFAIPAAIVQKVVPALIKSGHYEHPWLGLSGITLNPDLAQAMNLQADQRGALVVDVTPGGPADQAGLHGSDRQVMLDSASVRVGGDVVTAINGEPVKEFDDLVAYLGHSTEIGQAVKLTVLRDGQEETINTTLAARPGAEAQLVQSDGEVSGGVWLGIQGMDITSELAKVLNLPTGQAGVLVEQVEVNSPADEAGLHGSYKPITIAGERVPVGGDIITAIDGQPISQIEDLQSFLQQAKPGQKVTLATLRNGKKIDVTVTLSEQSATPIS